MTTTTTTTSETTMTGTTSYHQSLGRVVRSEWIKIRTLRSTWIGLIAVLVILIGFGALSAAVSTGSVSQPDDGGGRFGGTGPVATVLAGSNFAVLLVGVLGCLAGAREYSSGMISATATAVPRRWQIVLSKTVVLLAVVLPVTLLGVLGAYGGGMAILAAGDAETASLADGEVLRQVLGMAGYLVAIAGLGIGLGLLLRSVAGSIGAIVAGILILPQLAGGLLPDSWDSLLQLLPSSAGAAFTTVTGSGDLVLSPGAGAAVLVAWVVAAVAGAAVAISTRDV